MTSENPPSGPHESLKNTEATSATARSDTTTSVRHEPKRRTLHRFRKNWFNPIVQAIVIAALTLAITKGCDYYSNRVTEISYVVTESPAVIDKNTIADADLKITSGTRAIENLSTLSISLSNPNGKDLENLPVNFTFSPIAGTTPKLLRAKMLTPPERIESVKPPIAEDKNLRLAYKVVSANRYSPVLEVQFVFEGSQVPGYEIIIPKPGYSATKETQASRTTKDRIGTIVVSVISSLGAVVGLFVAIAGTTVIEGLIVRSTIPLRRRLNFKILRAMKVLDPSPRFSLEYRRKLRAKRDQQDRK